MSVTKCPLCGGVLFVSGEPGQGWKRDDLFQSTASPFGEAQLAGSWSKTTPHGRIEPRDVLTSLLDAGVTFLFVGVAGGGLAYVGGLDLLAFGVGAGFIGAAWRYFDGMSIARSLTQAIEEFASRDPEPEPAKTPPAKPHVVRAETVDAEGNWRFAEIAIAPEILSKFANDMLSQKTFSERTATAVGMTQAQFSRMRDQFIENGWARWNNEERKQQGAQLTKKGQAIIKAIAAEPVPPSPAGI